MINTERLIQTLTRYVACASESGKERAFCELLEGELSALGLTVIRDEVGGKCGSDGWNIIGSLPGEGEPILFSAHLDTVPPGEGIEAVVENGVIRSAGNTILGADCKAGIAAVVEVITVLKEQGLPHRPIEVFFTICEETGLLGSKHADYTKIKSKQAVVLDAATQGEMVNRSPAMLALHVEITGKSAHAAVAPEMGIHALKAAAAAIANIPAGRIGENSVINVANLLSPGKPNVVPEKASFDMDMRSLDRALLETHLEQVKAAIRAACEEVGATWEISENWQTDVLFIPPDSPVITRLKEVYAALGVPCAVEDTFGGSDATWLFETGGLDAINIGTGMTDVHSTDESITVADLELLAQVVLGMAATD